MTPKRKPAQRARVTAADLRSAGSNTRRSAAQIAAEVIARGKLKRSREIALMDAGIKKVDIERELQKRGKTVSHTTVSSVIAGTFRNADVETVFCELTGTQRSTMFPDDVMAATSETENAASA